MMGYLVFFVLVSFSLAEPVWNGQFWSRSSRQILPSEKKRVLIGIALKPGSLAACDNALTRLHDPSSPPKPHWSFEETGETFRNRAAEARVLAWVRGAGFRESELRLSPNGEFLRVTGSVERIEALLGCSFSAFVSKTENDRVEILRDLNWSLPEKLRELIDFVDGVDLLPTPRSVVMGKLKKKSARQGGNSLTPGLLMQVYNISGTVTNPKATQSVFESLGQSFALSDVASFTSQYGLLFPQINVVGPNNPSECSSNADNCAEASLDVQWITAVAQNATTWFWSVKSIVFEDMFVEFVEALASNASAPLVHSISYGSLAPETLKFNVERFNTETCKLGLRGITLVVASGDDGVANFWARSDPLVCLFSPFTPSFPATSPYVLSVGATQGPENAQPEVACMPSTSIITTGGGFSTRSPRPSYQASVVDTYLKTAPALPPLSKFASANRAYPDVAALGNNFAVIIGGQMYQVSGTSCAAPVVAGMLTLINNARLNAGKPAVGFVNPAVYAAPSSCFNDITVGRNNCAAGGSVCCKYGFNATAGFDPLTGLGSIHFDKFFDYMMK